MTTKLYMTYIKYLPLQETINEDDKEYLYKAISIIEKFIALDIEDEYIDDITTILNEFNENAKDGLELRNYAILLYELMRSIIRISDNDYPDIWEKFVNNIENLY